jgi:hypothetical protein
MKKYDWNKLNKQQVGAYTEYFVKMELTMYGFQVFTTEVDDRGIDFVARYESKPFIEIQVKSLRTLGYVFMQKTKFKLNENLYLAFGLLLQDEPPSLYLIPSIEWMSPNSVFSEKDYVGLKSKPEWGLNISKKHIPILEKYRFESTVQGLITPSTPML